MKDKYNTRSFFSSITKKDKGKVVLLTDDQKLTDKIERYLDGNFKQYSSTKGLVGTALTTNFKEALKDLARDDLLNPETISIVVGGCDHDIGNLPERTYENLQNVSSAIRHRVEKIRDIGSSDVLQDIVGNENIANDIVNFKDIAVLDEKKEKIKTVIDTLKDAEHKLEVVLKKMENPKFLAAKGDKLTEIVGGVLKEAIASIEAVDNIKDIGPLKDAGIGGKRINDKINKMQQKISDIENRAIRKKVGPVFYPLVKAFKHLKSLFVKAPEVSLRTQKDMLEALKTRYNKPEEKSKGKEVAAKPEKENVEDDVVGVRPKK